MPDSVTIIRDRQMTVRRQMDKRGISLKAVALDADMSYDTIKSYFPGDAHKVPAAIPGAAIFALCHGQALPLDLLSLLLPDGFQIVRAPEELNHDELEEVARDYLAAKGRAHHPDSPAGREISDGERSVLDGCALRLVGSVAA